MKKQIITLSAMGLMASSAFAFTHVTSDIVVNTTWTVANSPYILEDLIFVEPGVTLDIEPGVIVRGQPRTDVNNFNPGALTVRAGAKIQARGTVASPVIFTTAALDAGLASGGAATGLFKDLNADGFADRWVPADGDALYLDLNPQTAPLPVRNSANVKNANLWGGLQVLGNALINNNADVDGIPGIEIGRDVLEGLTYPKGVYGGENPEDNSGTLRYVSIRHGGAERVANRELNGLTLGGVGSKTTISHIDLYSTGDDGVEIFGGSVNLSFINVNFADDDGFDVDQGWQGNCQFIFVLQGQGYGDLGMEIDGNDEIDGGSAPFLPVSDGRIYNATIMANTVDNATTGDRGARFRAGYAGAFVNSIVVNSAGAGGTGLAIDGLAAGETAPSTQDNYISKLFQIRNTTINGFTTASTTFSGFTPHTNAGFVADVFFPATNNRTLALSIPVPNYTGVNGVNPRPSLGASSGAYGTTQDFSYVLSPNVSTSYKGAFDRTVALGGLWTEGWTALSIRGILK